MSVRQEKDKAGNKRWRMDKTHIFPDGQKRRVTKVLQAKTKRAAEAEERRILNAIDSREGSYGKKVPTFAEFQARYFRLHVSKQRPNTIRRLTSYWKCHLLPQLGSVRLNQVTTLVLDEYVAYYLDLNGDTPQAKRTVRKHLQDIHAVLAKAAEWELIAETDIRRSPKIKIEQREHRFLTFEQCEQFIRANGEEPIIAMIAFALATGLRFGELRALRWEHVDLEAGRVVVKQQSSDGDVIGPPKGNRTREVRFGHLGKWALRQTEGRSGYVFGGSEMWGRARCYRKLLAAYQRAGIDPAGFHLLRHTFASHLAMHGESMAAIQSVLGHTSIVQTEVYAQLSPERALQAGPKVDAGYLHILGTPKLQKTGTD